jgi:hypothetical protein
MHIVVFCWLYLSQGETIDSMKEVVFIWSPVLRGCSPGVAMSCELILCELRGKYPIFPVAGVNQYGVGMRPGTKYPLGFGSGVHVYNIKGQIGKDLGPASYSGFSIFVDLSLPLA